jgi:hypothetical protein
LRLRCRIIGDFEVEHEDVVMRMFVLTLEGESQAWYKSLLDASIDGWDSFQEKFTERWANTQDIFFLCTVFSIIKKQESENVFQFNTHFSKFYNRIPYRVRPNEVTALIYYLEAFDGIFGVFLRNEDPQNLEEAQAVTIKLERNYLAACELPPIHVPDQPVKVTPLDDLQPLVVTKVQEVCVIEDEPQLAPYQVPREEQEGDSPILDDPEPIAAPIESQEMFQEDEGEDVITQECSWVPPISEDERFQEDEKFQEEEPQVNQVEISQQGISSVPILVEASSFLSQQWSRNNLIKHHYSRRSHFWFNQRMMSLTLCLRFHISRLFLKILRLIRTWISEFIMTN